jgi:CO/xanthine dehydrogenase FAD-binding subunit
MNSFEYFKVFSISEALQLLSKYRRDAKLLAGGTDILLQIRQHIINPLYLIDLKGISNLNSINYKDGNLDIGASTSLKDTEKSEMIRSRFPALTEAAHQIATIQIRNRATLGGNLCQSIKCPYYNQSHKNLFMRQAITPCFKKSGKICHVTTWGSDVSNTIVGTSYCKAPLASDMAIVLAALGGRVELVAESGSREVNIDNFYKKDGKLNVAPGEILTRIRIPTGNTSGTAFLTYKVNPNGYTLLSVAISLLLEDDKRTCRGVKVYLGGVAQQPYCAKNVEGYLKDKKLTENIIKEAAQMLLENIDVSNDATIFKVTKARDLFKKAIVKSLEKCGGRLL